MAHPGYYTGPLFAVTCTYLQPTSRPQVFLWITVGILAIFWVIAVWMHLTGGLVTFGLGVCLLITVVVRLWLPRRRRQAERRPS